MRFAFDEEQLLFQATVREALEKECPPHAVRAAGEADGGRSWERWRRLGALGVLGLLAPQEHGGMGHAEVDLVLLLEEAGRALLPEPLTETAAVAVPLLRDADGEDLAARWLPRASAGECVLAVALTATPYAADADVADVVLVEQDGALFAVQPEALELVRQPSLDPSRRIFRVRMHAPPAPFAAGSAAIAAGGDAFDRGALATAAQLLGIGRRVVEMGAAYAKERRQFGRPIGTFQAVKHLLADALLRVEFAAPVVYRAAHSVATRDPERSRDVSMAKTYASEAALGACRSSLQVHGAIGYTTEHDLHLWLRRAWALAGAWGDGALHLGRVRESVLRTR